MNKKELLLHKVEVNTKKHTEKMLHVSHLRIYEINHNKYIVEFISSYIFFFV